MMSNLFLLIISSLGLIYLAESFPADADPADPGDESNFSDGRPPQWSKSSTKKIDEQNKKIVPAEASNIQGRIVGGVDVEVGEVPYQVAVMVKDVGQICGGTVYSEYYVVTAAHCLFDDGEIPAKNLQVIAGELNLRKSGPGKQMSDVEKTFIHPDYDKKDGYNDAAIFKLTKPFKWTEYVAPLRIAHVSDNKNRQVKAVVSGWGYTEKLEKGDQIDDSNFPDTLKMVYVNLVEKPECEILHKNKAYKWAKHRSFLCAGSNAGGRDACQADSGGPLACFEKKGGRKFHCGIVANGVGCARKATPGFYTDVAVFHDWIVKTAGKQPKNV